MYDYTFSVSAVTPSIILSAFFGLGFCIGFFTRDLEFLIDDILFSIRRKNREKTIK